MAEQWTWGRRGSTEGAPGAEDAAPSAAAKPAWMAAAAAPAPAANAAGNWGAAPAAAPAAGGGAAAAPPDAPAEISARAAEYGVGTSTGGPVTVNKALTNFGTPLVFRHVGGAAPPKERTFFNLTPNLSANLNSPLLACSATHWAVPWTGSAGPFYVSRLADLGKVEPGEGCPLLHAHKSPVLDLAFAPTDDGLLASAGDDALVAVWRLPPVDAGPCAPGLEPAARLSAHTHSVRTVQFHPSAAALLLSTSQDKTARVWDLNHGGGAAEALKLSLPEACFNTSWSLDGALFASFARDLALRVHDPRAAAAAGGAGTAMEAPGAHCGTKGGRVAWLTGAQRGGAGPEGMLLTAGFGAMSGREMKMWDPRNLGAGPTQTIAVDNAGGVLYPLYDGGTNMVYLAGRGDGSVRLYELQGGDAGGPPTLQFDNTYSAGGEPTSGAALLPTRACDVRGIEVARMLRLGQTMVEPVSFTMPRTDKKKAYFQDDVFPPAPVATPAHDAAAWLGGANAAPAVASLLPEGMMPLSQAPKEEKKIDNSVLLRQKIDHEKIAKDKKDAVVNKMQELAVAHHAHNPTGAKSGVDYERIDDSDGSDNDWGDEDSD